MKARWNNLNSDSQTNIILILLVAASIIIGILTAFDDQGQIKVSDIGISLSTGLITPVITYLLIDRLVGKKVNEERIVAEKKQQKDRLINDLRSLVKDDVVRAIEELRSLRWLIDGTLRGADLSDAKLGDTGLLWADLQAVTLKRAELENAILVWANLQNADLSMANLKRASLHGAKLQGANLTGSNLVGAFLDRIDMPSGAAGGRYLDGTALPPVEFDETTILPDGNRWAPGVDLRRFTDPKHRNFWTSNDLLTPSQ